VALITPAALLTIPIFDTAIAIVRRKLTGRSIYSTDRGHIHHCLLRSGLSTRRVLLLVAMLCLIIIIGVLASLAMGNELMAMIAAATVVGILVVGRLFGHAEFLLIKERLRGLLAASNRGPSRQASLELSVRLQGSAQWQEIWESLLASAAQADLAGVCLDVNIPALHEGYHARWNRLDQDAELMPIWRVEIPLLAEAKAIGRLEVLAARGSEPLEGKMDVAARMAAEVEAAVKALVSARRTASVAAFQTEIATPGAPADAAAYAADRAAPPLHAAPLESFVPLQE
jgi:UDP-GlcNAc:undecaprenyl-phosphate GlcNAc-1-phosphate transferase